MRSFPSTDLKQTLGDVLHAASGAPVAITRHNKPRYVIMSIDHYEQRFSPDQRTSHLTSEMPKDHLDLLNSVTDADPEDKGT